MDNNASVNQAMALLMQMVGAMSSSRMGAMAGGMGGGYSPYGIYGVHGMDSIYPEPQMFGGPLLNGLATTFGPSLGLSATGIDGNPAFLFKTTFTRPGDGTVPSYSAETARRNQAAAVGSNSMYAYNQVSNWDRIFGETSKMYRYLGEIGAPPEVQALYASMGSNGPVGKLTKGLIQPMIDGMLGYDRGAGLANAQQRASQMGAALTIRGLASGSKLGFNPFSDAFTDLRSGLASHVYGATDAVMYDGNVKKASVFGASEKLVSDIIADAVISGKANELLGSHTLGESGMDLINRIYDEAERGKYQVNTNLSVENTSDIYNTAKKKIESIEKQNFELQQKISEAKDNGDDEKIWKQYENQMKDNAKEIEAINSGLKKLGSNTSEGYKPLVEAVTEAVDTLKDLYGGEDAAREALSQITGGKGMTDKGIAVRAASQIRELKVYAGMAGLDPKVAGEILNGAMESVLGRGGTLAEGSAYQGQSAVRVAKEALKNVALTGDMDPQKSKEIIAATQARAASYANSETAKLATLVMASENDIDKGGFNRIMDLLGSGRRDDFQRAKALFGDLTSMSDKRVEKMMNDPTLLARLQRNFSFDQAERLNTLATTAINNNDSDIMGRSKIGVSAERARYNLSRAGLGKRDADAIQGEGEYNGLVEHLSDTGNSAATTALQNIYDEVKAKHPKWDDDRIKAEAAKRFKRVMKDVIRDSEARKKAEEAMRNGGAGNLFTQEYFTGGDLLNTGNDSDNAWLGDIGASDDRGDVTRVALGAAANDVLDTATRLAKAGVLKDSEGNKITAKQISAVRKRVKAGIKAGTLEGGQNASSAIAAFLRSLDTNSRKVLDLGEIGKNAHYITSTDVQNLKSNQDAMAKAMADENAAQVMSGMKDENMRQIYANIFSQTEGKNLDDEEVRKAAEALEKFEKGDMNKPRTDLERVWKAVQDDPEKGWEEITNSNLTIEQKKAMMDALASKFSGVVGDKQVSETKSKAEGGSGFTVKYMNALLDSKSVDATKNYFAKPVTMDSLMSVDEDEAVSLLSTMYGEKLSKNDNRVTSFISAQKKAREGDVDAFLRQIGQIFNEGDAGRRQDLDAKFKAEGEAIDKELADVKEKHGENSDEYSKAKEEYDKKKASLAKRRTAAEKALASYKEKGLKQVEEWNNLSPVQREEKLREMRENGIFPGSAGKGAEGSGGSGPSEVSLSGPIEVNGFNALLDKLDKVLAKMSEASPSLAPDGRVPIPSTLSV